MDDATPDIESSQPVRLTTNHEESFYSILPIIKGAPSSFYKGPLKSNRRQKQ